MRAIGWIVVAMVGLPSAALGQHPGYLGRQAAPPRVRAKPLPRWPRKVDPEPLSTKHYLDLHLELVKNKVKVIKVVKGTFASGPRVLPRFRGRFEAQLFSAGLMIDVVRFDFPLTGSGAARPGRGGLDSALSKGVAARTRVRVPFDERITRATIVDTQSKQKVPVDLSPVGVRPKVKPKLPSDLRTSVFRFGLAPSKPTTRPKPKNTKTKKAKSKAGTKAKAKGKGGELGETKIFRNAKQPKKTKKKP
jgi:hypothetical protein